MLCPEVWNFKAPESRFNCTPAESVNQETDCTAKSFANFYFNHLVSVTLPDTLNVPESITSALIEDCEYYKLTRVTADRFVQHDFIENFIKKGNFTGLSVNTRIDCDDCIAVTPTGKLILSLTKETYQSLGIEGKLSHFNKLTKNRYVVRINLSESHFVPGKKNYERTKSRLSTLGCFDFIFKWQPYETTVCPSSPAKFFNDTGIEVKLCQVKFNTRTEYQVPVPKIPSDDGTDLTEDKFDVAEWMGMIGVGGEFDSVLSSYSTPTPNQVVGQVKYIEWRGMFTPKEISTLVELLRNFIKNNEKPFACIYVQGFSDSPVNWGENEHHFYTNGDNAYIVTLTDVTSFTSLTTSNKIYK